jgi:ketosteroid isomerase-like protein
MTTGNLQTVRDSYRAYETGDRERIEQLIAADYVFSAPPDVGIDRPTYFERCWPNAGHITGFEFVRLLEAGGEVLVTYEATRTDGTRFRNTEIHAVEGEQLVRTEVYFGWDL